MDKNTKRIITMNNLSFNINKNKILNNINLEICHGDRIGIVGPNGAGKSTLLKIISGILPPSTGKLKFDADSIKNIGVHLTNDLPGYFLGIDYLRYCGTLKNMSVEQIEMAIQQLSDELEITYLHKRIKNYSQGMRKRLAIAGTLIHFPDLVLFDEPTNFLDNRGKELFTTHVKKNPENTYIITNHDVNELYKVCNKIITIDKGIILELVEINPSPDMYKIYIDKFIADFNIQTEKDYFYKIISKNEINQNLRYLLSKNAYIMDIQILN